MHEMRCGGATRTRLLCSPQDKDHPRLILSQGTGILCKLMAFRRYRGGYLSRQTAKPCDLIDQTK